MSKDARESRSPIDVESLRRLVEDGLGRVVDPDQDGVLHEATRYVLEGGGKRIRPLLTLLSAAQCGLDPARAIGPAVAVEVFHNFTLVHDDIMDRSPTRRGRPTVHERWDESTAILVGDLLLGLAYEQLGRARPDAVPELLTVFSAMVRRLCEGQMADMEMAKRTDVTLDEYVGMIDGKTGALLSCALELGAVAAGAGPAFRRQLVAIGRDLGRAFQIRDDLLDLTARSGRWGKPVGGDILEGKRTWLLLSALDRAEANERVLLEQVLAGRAGPQDIDPVRAAMEQLGVLTDSEAAVILHSEAALAGVDALSDHPARTVLRTLVHDLVSRTN